MTQNPTLQIGLTGHFLLEAVNAETGERRFLAEFDNLITNGGLDRLGAATASQMVISHVQVGTGSTTPANTDTALANYLAGTNRSYTFSSSYAGASTYHTECTHSWQFDQGAAAGNLSEIGVGWAASGSLFSRALIVDGGGNPTTITVAAIEFLSVTYKLRMYPPTTDVTGNITLDGSSYAYTIRPSGAGGSSWANHGPGAYGTATAGNGQITPYTNVVAYTGDIGAMTAAPSGTTATLGLGTPSVAAYSSGSYKRTCTVSAGISELNLSGGIRSIQFMLSGTQQAGSGGSTGRQMAWQCQFDPKIPKDNTKTLSLTFDVSWARKP